MSSRLLTVLAGASLLFGVSFESKADQGPAATGGPKHLLRYKFVQGQTLYYEVSTAEEYTNQVGGSADTAWSKSETRRHFRVKSVDQDGSGMLELFIDRVRMSSQGSSTSRVMEFDSQDPAKQPPAFKGILERLGKSQASLNVTSRGEPVKVVPNPDAPVSANKPVSVDAEASAESFLTVLPEQPVAVGEKWTERFEVPVLNSDRLTIKILMLRACRLAEVKDGIARIEFKTAVLTPLHDPSLSAKLVSRETMGILEFDLNQGEIISRTSNVDRTVVGAYGEKSSLRAVKKYVERQIPPEGQAGSPPRVPRL